MARPFRRTAAVSAALALAGCGAAHPRTASPSAPPTDFTLTTTPAGASVETSYGYHCTTPCRLPLGQAAYAATVTMLGYKPVQVPVVAGRDPGPLSVTLQPQDPGGAAPTPAGAR